MTNIVKQEFHIQITSNNKTAVDYLAEASGLSRQKIKQAMQKGCVWLETSSVSVNQKNNPNTYIQRLRRAKKVLQQSDILYFYYDEAVLSSETKAAILIADWGAYSVWNKPSGMLSQGSKWGDHCTVYRWAEKHLLPERPAFIVHRLDKAANGLIILAHKKSVASQFSNMFEQRQIDKRYQVKVAGDFSQKLTDENATLTINTEVDGKSALSHVKILAVNAAENTSTLEVNIETGRKHQIRKHLSSLGFPVVGDRLYGNEAPEIDLQLQAKSLKFICPVTKEARFFTLDSQPL